MAPMYNVVIQAILNITVFVLYVTVVFLNMTGLVLNMTEIVPNMTVFNFFPQPYGSRTTKSPGLFSRLEEIRKYGV